MLSTKVEIHIPCFNEEENLSRMIGAIESQTFQSWRLFIHDNASTDQTPEIAKDAQHRTAGKIQHIRYRKKLSPFGQMHRITKFPHASSYIWMRSANDLVGHDYLENAIALLEQDLGASIAYSHGFVVYRDDMATGFRSESEVIDTRGLAQIDSAVAVATRYASPFSLWGVYRREVFESLQVKTCYGADHIWVCEAAIAGAVVPIDPLCDFRIVSRRSGPNENNALNDIFHFWDSHHNLRLQGVTRDSLFMTADIDLPITSMIVGHFEMVSGLQLFDEQKIALWESLRKALVVRFQSFLELEHQYFLGSLSDRIAQIDLSATTYSAKIHLFSSIDEGLRSIIAMNPKYADAALIQKEQLIHRMSNLGQF